MSSSEEKIRHLTVAVGRVHTAIGTLLVTVGVAFYAFSGGRSLTAAIPAFFGLPLTILSAVVWSDWPAEPNSRRKVVAVVAHIALLISLAGAGGGGWRAVVAWSSKKSTLIVLDCLALCILSSLHVATSIAHFRRVKKIKRSE